MSIQSHNWNIIAREGLPRDTRFPLGTVPEPEPPPDLGTLAAFPGAVGSGAIASIRMPGVRVIQVTNLNDSGSGSLRAACEASGPRIIVFRVSGTIVVTGQTIQINNPHCYIAGQTAPGQGIQISFKDPNRTYTTFDYREDWAHIGRSRSLFRIRAHNCIVRYLKFRVGFMSRWGAQRFGGATMQNFLTDPRRMGDSIIDHCSTNWSFMNAGPDNSARPSDFPWKNTTIMNCLSGETLDYHATGMNVNTSNRTCSEICRDWDYYRNILHNCTHRMPQIAGGHGPHRWVNNMIYNWRRNGMVFFKGIQPDVIKNFFKQGRYAWQPGDTDGLRNQEIAYHRALSTTTDAGNQENSYYLEGNLGPYRADGGANENTLRYCTGRNCAATSTPPPEWRRYTRHPSPQHPFIELPASELEASLLPDVGASHRLDSMGNWVYNRDSCDERVIQDIQNSDGWIISTDHAPPFDSSMSYLGYVAEGNTISSPNYHLPGDYVEFNGNIYEARNNTSAPSPAPSGTQSNNDHWWFKHPAISGIPNIQSATPYVDSNNDGVPDDWSNAAGISPTASNSGLAYHSSGYMYIELFLQGIKPWEL